MCLSKSVNQPLHLYAKNIYSLGRADLCITTIHECSEAFDTNIPFQLCQKLVISFCVDVPRKEAPMSLLDHVSHIQRSLLQLCPHLAGYNCFNDSMSVMNFIHYGTISNGQICLK